jgi:hypothetical protein
MQKAYSKALAFAATALACITMSGVACATTYNMGDISYDVTSSTTAQFDITNLTGPNALALGDPAFPVTNGGTAVGFTITSLKIMFSDGSTENFGSSYFTTSLDGESLDGSAIAIGGASVLPVSAMLTGVFDMTSISLVDGSTATILPGFTATVTDAGSGPLVDGDASLIVATTGTTPVPEPGTLPLLIGGIAGIVLAARRRVRAAGKLFAAAAVCAVGFTAMSAPASAATRLTGATTPSSGAAGVTSVNLTVSGLPTGVTAGMITVNLAPTCAVGATVKGEISTTASGVSNLFGLGRVQFKLPASLAQATYFVNITGTSSGGIDFSSTDCSVVAVSHTTKTLNACLPTSSLAVAIGTNVMAYAPNGAWDVRNTGIQAVPIEGGGSPATIATANPVNSCSSNPATGETVCTANNTDVYLITGTTLTTTLTSGATGSVQYSGGGCQNCGVAIDALNNTAYIAEGSNTAPYDSGSQLQGLNLTTGTFLTPFVTTHELSEDISIDPGRNLVLSASYGESFSNPTYDLYSLDPSGNVTAEYTSSPYSSGAYPDSSSEDCTTGIALSSDEEASAVFLANLTQATFTGGTWSAPSQLEQLVNTTGFSAGVTGMAVAPGSTHLGVISGEFGGNTFAAMKLPDSAGTGVPALVDYVSAYLPATPDGNGFSAGYDPHTVTAYTSPNNGKAYGVIADWATGSPSYLAVIDLDALLKAPRQPGTAIVSSTVDLVASGIVRYVATH